MKGKSDRFARSWFRASALLLMLGYGVVAGMFGLFPARWVAQGIEGGAEFAAWLGWIDGGSNATWYYREVPAPYAPAIQSSPAAQPGLTLVTEMQADGALCVRVIDLDGHERHRWSIDWFAIWPDATHVPERLLPRARPGTHVHGAALLDDGELVFNFEHLGLVRLARDGTPVWRLPYQTHHSVHVDENGLLWVCGQKEHTTPSAEFPNQVPPFVEDTVLVVTPDGRIMKEWSVPRLLRANGRQGLLHLGTLNNFSTVVAGELTHLNHVEPFPASMTEGFFKKTDVLVSLRNVNTVLTFDRDSGRITFLSVGQFVRQHDPHFVDGDRVSVFDNNNIGPESVAPQSRIAILSAPDQTVTTYYSGTPAQPFFTPFLGKHQWLENGNLLITDSCEGRAIELDRHRRPVWSYINYVGEGTVGVVEQAQRLPTRTSQLFAPH